MSPSGPVKPREAILACLVQPLPCSVCGSTKPCRCADPAPREERRADLIVETLARLGMLPAVAPEPTLEDAARWLAEQSGFARYTAVEDGWRRLLESPADVLLASTYATKSAASVDAAAIDRARARLIAWHRDEGRT